MSFRTSRFRYLALALPVAFLIYTSQGSKSLPTPQHVRIAYDGVAPAPLSIEYRQDDTVVRSATISAPAGSFYEHQPELPNGTYIVAFHTQGHMEQERSVVLQGSTVTIRAQIP